MSFTQIRLVVISSWLASLIVVLSVGLMFGFVTSPWNGAILFLLGCVPAMILSVLFRGAPPQTIAEVLYDANQAATTPSERRYATITPPDKQ